MGIDKSSHDGIYEIFSHSDGKLYASTFSKSNKIVLVYQLDETNLKWKSIGGNGVNGSWINKGFNIGFSMTTHNNLFF